MRKFFHPLLLSHMRQDERIWLITPDLGYKMFDNIFTAFPDRCLNAGAAEQLALGVAIGLAQEGKIPIVYSITPFVLWRGAEWIRNYLHYEGANVKLLSAGRGDGHECYAHDGHTHWAYDAPELLKLFPSIRAYWPESEGELESTAQKWLEPGAAYLNLRR